MTTPAPWGALCPNCDGTGDVHTFDGEWRGRCPCTSEAAMGVNILRTFCGLPPLPLTLSAAESADLA
jgi:hypothetical protein